MGKINQLSFNNKLYENVDRVSYSEITLLAIIHYKDSFFKRPYLMELNNSRDLEYLIKYCKDNNIDLKKINK